MRRHFAILAALAVALALTGCQSRAERQAHQCVQALDAVQRAQIESQAAGQISQPGSEVVCVIQPDGSRGYYGPDWGDYLFYGWLGRAMWDSSYSSYGWMRSHPTVYNSVTNNYVTVKGKPPKAPTTAKATKETKAKVAPAKTTVTYEPPSKTKTTYEPEVTSDGKKSVPTTAKPKASAPQKPPQSNKPSSPAPAPPKPASTPKPGKP